VFIKNKLKGSLKYYYEVLMGEIPLYLKSLIAVMEEINKNAGPTNS